MQELPCRSCRACIVGHKGEICRLADLAVHEDAGLPLVLAVAAAHAHEAAGALPAAEAPPGHFGPLTF